ncbi:selenide, water dikinase SelD [Hymenobacter taeanensis]|uniref:Selenide, water dikinase n=1 Tax=Hymenobacter taeanensis TaxID=2735321 RepID=A0A6M6BFS7_9BACT|nr:MULTISPECIES: selenide, water dikinase SelD [Hymenobacter]QJX47126.1 selenide, water dikinase SelD [Hymenobacter taeanensis]UOQ81041.1 selenide, water dikinase SelD [Hymenobacter sp. 5414T-23]
MSLASEPTDQIRLTQYSHGAGCGCKIAPKVLDQILHTSIPQPHDAQLLVGNSSRDDAAVYDIGGGQAIISTTDFFMPIVDDAYDFGRIASANAISDVYAMGGRPVMAIAVLGWPIDKLAPEVARRVIEGSRSICAEAGIPLAGGHSIDSPEPIFGLAVTGLLDINNLKQNDTATAGCELYLTKPLGVGMLTTAQKRGILRPEHEQLAPESMMQLNKIGQELGQVAAVRAMTDVTGFGLLGHLSEVCEGSNLTAEVEFSKVPLLAAAEEYRAQGAVPGGTIRNWDSYGHKIGEVTAEQRQWLCDPQTSGGLLVCVEPGGREQVLAIFERHGLQLEPFGRLREHVAGEPWISVR